MVNRDYEVKIVGGNIDAQNVKDKEGSNYFSAFEGSDGEIIISDPFMHRLIFHCTDTGVTTYKYMEEQSFPRWIIPYDNKYFYVDRNLNEIGFIDKKGNLTRQKVSDMENLISASISYDGNLLICGRGKKPLIKIDEELNIIEEFFDASCNFQSAQEIEKGKFLIVDIAKSIVYICDESGEIYWKHGIQDEPGNGEAELLSPKYACIKANKVYIADTKNNRVKIIDILSNSIRCIYGDSLNRLWYPTCIDIMKNNDLLVTDCLNQRVVRINEMGEIVWQYGLPVFSPNHVFNSPRMIEIVDNDIFVINAYSNDLVKIEADNLTKSYVYKCSNLQLFWPKGIRRYHDEHYFICDSRNGRIIVVDIEMNSHRLITHLTDNNEVISLQDPHDIDIDKKGNLIITDAGANVIYLVEPTGKIIWKYGVNGELLDPHQCRVIEGGSYMIADSGHNRIIFINSSGDVIKEIKNLDYSCLKKPRWCEKIGKNYLIADTGNNRVVAINQQNKVTFEYGGEWGAGIYAMRQPRCVKMYDDKIIISDTDNNRVIILEGVVIK